MVGNGGVNLNDPHQGRAIDSADVVIRFNDGPTSTFERFVGKKTTFRLINNQWSRHVADRGAVGGWSEGVLMCFGNGARRSFEDVCKKQTSAKIVFMHPVWKVFIFYFSLTGLVGGRGVVTTPNILRHINTLDARGKFQSWS